MPQLICCPCFPVPSSGFGQLEAFYSDESPIVPAHLLSPLPEDLDCLIVSSAAENRLPERLSREHRVSSPAVLNDCRRPPRVRPMNSLGYCRFNTDADWRACVYSSLVYATKQPSAACCCYSGDDIVAATSEPGQEFHRQPSYVELPTLGSTRLSVLGRTHLR
jgi:hypothetical protein